MKKYITPKVEMNVLGSEDIMSLSSQTSGVGDIIKININAMISDDMTNDDMNVSGY